MKEWDVHILNYLAAKRSRFQCLDMQNPLPNYEFKESDVPYLDIILNVSSFISDYHCISNLSKYDLRNNPYI